MCYFSSANAQQKIRIDSLSKTKKSIELPDSTIIISRDTIVFLMDTVIERKQDAKKNGSKFYHAIQRGAYKRKFTKELYKLIFVAPDKMSPTDTLKTERSETAFIIYQGKTIRNIEVRVLEPFGSSLLDTSKVAKTWIERTGNKLHHTSRRGHLKKMLHIEQGDILDAYTLADNERLIRQLNYIKDAYFRVIPVKGSNKYVDLQLWVKDQFSWGANVDLGSRLSTEFEIYSRNLYGLGHEFSNTFHYETDEDQKFGYTGSYTIRNIKRSYIDASFSYENTYEKSVVGISFDRDFETYNTKRAGGFSISKNFRSNKIMDDDPIRNEVPLDFTYSNLWYGRAIKLNSKSLFARRKMFFTGRVAARKFFERPLTTPTLNQFFHNNILYLGGISISKTQFYKSNLIYNFGRTEDIPYGYLAQMNFGYEDREYSHRYYLGFDFQNATYVRKTRSYLFNRIAIGGFFNSRRFEQGSLIAQSKFFSRIRKLGALRFRNFGDLKYTLGIRRFPEEIITINNRYGIRGFKSQEVTGKQKLTLNLETVTFTPYTIGEFKFAYYTFGDLGIIGSNQKHIFKGDYYYGLGFGIRLHNENLVFKTIQLRLAFYPKVPSDFHSAVFRLSGEERPRFNDFNVGQPEVIPYE
ncbi:hypothetical protein [Marinifilum sp.]|uniref:hypothetical protein n=1 Tax=Marinifilum sp. TaxID=2033137 RepID=UPI003BAA07DD